MRSWEDRSTETVSWREGGFEPKPSDSYADSLRGRLLWTSGRAQHRCESHTACRSRTELSTVMQ